MHKHEVTLLDKPSPLVSFFRKQEEREWGAWFVIAPFRNHEKTHGFLSVLTHHVSHHLRVGSSRHRMIAEARGPVNPRFRAYGFIHLFTKYEFVSLFFPQVGFSGVILYTTPYMKVNLLKSKPLLEFIRAGKLICIHWDLFNMYQPISNHKRKGQVGTMRH